MERTVPLQGGSRPLPSVLLSYGLWASWKRAGAQLEEPFALISWAQCSAAVLELGHFEL